MNSSVGYLKDSGCFKGKMIDWKSNMMLVGISGSGKTETLKSILLDLKDVNENIVIKVLDDSEDKSLKRYETGEKNDLDEICRNEDGMLFIVISNLEKFFTVIKGVDTYYYKINALMELLKRENVCVMAECQTVKNIPSEVLKCFGNLVCFRQPEEHMKTLFSKCDYHCKNYGVVKEEFHISEYKAGEVLFCNRDRIEKLYFLLND